MKAPTVTLLLVLSCLASTPLCGEEQAGIRLNEFLAKGQLQSGIEYYSAEVAAKKSQESIFALGLLRFVRSIEELGQGLHRYGLKSEPARRVGIPFLRLPVPHNANPEPVNPAKFAAVLEKFHSDLKAASDTLGQLQDSPFVLYVDLARIPLDFDGDGKPDQTLLDIYRLYTRSETPAAGGGPESGLVAGFDLGDGFWLQGYCHLLMSICDLALACDGTDLFDATAQLFFSKPETTLFTMTGGMPPTIQNEPADLADWIALVHTLRFPIARPERMQAIGEDLRHVIQCSRKSWAAIEAETDDDKEWLPNAKQKAITGTTISAEMIVSWKAFLDEAEAILEGRKLIPHWRFSKQGLGVNLRKVLAEPQLLDAVLWIQGTAAVPYLEKGNLSSGETWTNITRSFQGNFIGFAVWIN